VSNLVKLIGVHGTVVFATPEKAQRLQTMQGYRVVDESASEEVSEPVTPRRGRPKKQV
jgi:hypothetical protein